MRLLKTLLMTTALISVTFASDDTLSETSPRTPHYTAFDHPLVIAALQDEGQFVGGSTPLPAQPVDWPSFYAYTAAVLPYSPGSGMLPVTATQVLTFSQMLQQIETEYSAAILYAKANSATTSQLMFTQQLQLIMANENIAYSVNASVYPIGVNMTSYLNIYNFLYGRANTVVANLKAATEAREPSCFDSLTCWFK